MPPGFVVVPEAAREVTFIRSSDVVVVVVVDRAPGTAPGTVVVEDVAVSRMTVLSRPRNSAKRTRRIRTATARIPSTPPGKVVVVVVVVVASVVRVAVPVVVTSDPPVVVGVCGAAV